MNIIRTIEINYFRSIYRARIKNLKPLNIFSGGNDVGKSNILKALNLFFNNETDWREKLDFYQDFNIKRLNVVRNDSIRGKQFISVSITFNRPKNYKNSLPEKFRITRRWDRKGELYHDKSNLETKKKNGLLPSSINTANRFLQHFINRVHYEYIPAIKDRAFYVDILSRLQKELLDSPITEDEKIAELAEQLAGNIQGKIVTLSNEFRRISGVNSRYSTPNKTSDIFKALPIVTESTSKESIPLNLRGDGIQSQYLLAVLEYMNQNSKDFMLWGFEEPENSLEYSRIAKLSEDLLKKYSEKAQIFVTSHSPALTCLKNENNTCHRVFTEEKEGNLIIKIGDISLPDEELYTENIGETASRLATKGNIRKLITERVREFAKNNNVVVEGRDIGTYQHKKYLKKYRQNPSTCEICESKLSYQKRNNKTCSEDCRNKLLKIKSVKNSNCGGSTGRSNGEWYYNENENEEVWFDSSWEVKFAEYLDGKNIGWVRPSYFEWEDENNVKRKYYPDFYLLENNLYVDIKNNYLRSLEKTKRKIRKVRENNSIRLEVWSEEDLRELGVVI